MALLVLLMVIAPIIIGSPPGRGIDEVNTSYMDTQQAQSERTCLSNLDHLLYEAFKGRNKERSSKRTTDGLREKYWASIRNEMNYCLMLNRYQLQFLHQQNIRIPTSIFNRFLNFIIEFGVNEDVNGSSLQLIDEYYLLAKSVGVKPDAVTFNILLRANRICMNRGAVRGKLVSVHMNEMAECGIAADSYTIAELLAMCAKWSRSINE